MSLKASITVLRPREDVERLWRDAKYPHDNVDSAGATVRFADAPGDRGTEIHVELGDREPGRFGRVVQKVTGAQPLAKAKDDLRRFKQQVETGVVPRSESVPEGESAERKFKQRPAQPLTDAELEKAGVS
jgi:uncharacterized membrane protein